MNKELRKTIYTRSRLRNIFCKNTIKENEKSKKTKQICLLERKQNFKNISKDGDVVTHEKSWSVNKPFLKNKGHIAGEERILKINN